MDMLKHNFVVQAPRVYFAFLVGLTLILTGILIYADPNADSRWIGVLSGLVSGIGIAALQFFTQYLEQKKLEEYKKHGLVEFLINRKDPEYYRKLIKSTKVSDKIIVIGVTCNRLLDDFANPDVYGAQDLSEALARGVEVTLLVPKTKYLSEADRADFTNKTLPQSAEINQRYPTLFKINYYDFEPTHSIFLAGSNCVVGPIFKNKKSKDTPAINFNKDGLYTRLYLEYINETIANASDDYE
ncbi:hypothetical protein [Pseudomonas sp. NPDC090201]|uniref:hypothetical protein n=1 Tax=Pseudomonas sp. NPDC090201 TaxID=3364475 RepID=UPI00380EA060